MRGDRHSLGGCEAVGRRGGGRQGGEVEEPRAEIGVFRGDVVLIGHGGVMVTLFWVCPSGSIPIGTGGIVCHCKANARQNIPSPNPLPVVIFPGFPPNFVGTGRSNPEIV